ncbi:MarR family winged helix-turn-helix transcriptional regulator [Streptomyces hoynatensis]|uniref:MarR family transcriptional regulator n=1 Tax=Streptomyces hoynatensis TaxID=1141874 RepID=A0A3A9ZC14_9ACTN|nr:MarR family transcriptional regulator [Streptomyces hoynatensis]RKN45725.1 MarR family transcriptional regulator [Streptomyces hoynatensis]
MDLSTETANALQRLFRLFRRLSAPSELSLTAVSTLSTLERTGPHRLTELAAREGVTQPAMTQLVSRLQEAGLAARATDPSDGRVVLVHLTEAGRATLARRRELRAERLKELLDRLSPDERSALAAALPAIDALTRLEPEEQPRPGATASPPAPVPDPTPDVPNGAPT